MPELAEVEYYRKQWLPALNQTVTSVHLNSDKRVFRGLDCAALKQNLVQEKFIESLVHGKQLCFRFGDSHWLGVHLGMTGKIQVLQAGELPAKHDHLILRMDSKLSLVFSDARMFGRILYTNHDLEPDWWAHRPPEILSPEYSFERVDTYLNRRTKSPIKAVLLVQEFFPGVGNWMADEILWRSRILPSRKCGKINMRERMELYTRIHEVSEDAMRVIGADWGRPPENWLFNHRWKAGGSCPQTGKLLSRAKVGGRTSCWSPSWQS